jgi:signal transduction histidine kinase
VLISLYRSPGPALGFVLMLCTIAVVYVAILWNARRNLIPVWFSTSFSVVMGCAGLWLTYKGDYFFVEYLVQASLNFMAALLFVFAYRRFSPGVIFTSLGFFLWSTPLLLDAIFTTPGPAMLMIGRGINLVKVMTAVGMILIVLEDESAQNKMAKDRDHRARVELEEYSQIDLSLLSGVNEEAVYQHVCEVVTQVSRFGQALIFLRSVENNFRAIAHAGMDAPLALALDALGRRVTPEQIEIFRRTENIAVEMSSTLLVDLRPLFVEDDALEQLQHLKSHVIPFAARTGATDGSLFLSGLKEPEKPLRADDVLPLELLVGRLTTMRGHNTLMQRVAQSEKLASLGQLAAGVAHELNNPLTVVLGYSQMLEESLEDHPAHENLSLIRSEAQRMRLIIESMLRFWKASPVEHIPVSLTEILQDICSLRRAEFNRRGVELLLHLPDDLPPVCGNRNQLQQVFLQLLNNSLEAFDADESGQPKAVRIDASHHEDAVKVLISDNGPGFADPHRAFDPFFTTKSPRAGTGMGLSVCYAIVRDHGGEITAHNQQPHGAALLIELPLKPRGFAAEMKDKALSC